MGRKLILAFGRFDRAEQLQRRPCSFDRLHLRWVEGLAQVLANVGIRPGGLDLKKERFERGSSNLGERLSRHRVGVDIASEKLCNIARVSARIRTPSRVGESLTEALSGPRSPSSTPPLATCCSACPLLDQSGDTSLCIEGVLLDSTRVDDVHNAVDRDGCFRDVCRDDNLALSRRCRSEDKCLLGGCQIGVQWQDQERRCDGRRDRRADRSDTLGDLHDSADENEHVSTNVMRAIQAVCHLSEALLLISDRAEIRERTKGDSPWHRGR